jgi:nucleotide-binding universal stress UspA family protein
MIKVILTTNFSESARNAMIYAVQLFGSENTSYTIMNTLIDSPTGNDGFLSVEKLNEGDDSKNIKGEETFLRKIFPDNDLKIDCRTVYGHLVPAVNELSKELAANYVVIGNRENFPIDVGILRAKTYEMIERIECPVIAVPANREFREGEGGLVFASDLNTIKKPDHLEPLVRLASQHEVPVMVINVKRPKDVKTKEQEEAGVQLNKIFDKVKHEIHQLENEDVLVGISGFVESNGSSLLILLARKHNFFKRLTSQSLTKEMSKLANMPLLILHDY